MTTQIWKPRLALSVTRRAARHAGEHVRPSREHALDLQVDGGVAEAAGELQRVDAPGIGDAVDVDVAGVVHGGKAVPHPEQRLLEERAGPVPEPGRCPSLRSAGRCRR